MLTYEKLDRTIKARGCADGRSQREYTAKSDTSSTMVSLEALNIYTRCLQHCLLTWMVLPGHQQLDTFLMYEMTQENCLKILPRFSTTWLLNYYIFPEGHDNTSKWQWHFYAWEFNILTKMTIKSWQVLCNTYVVQRSWHYTRTKWSLQLVGRQFLCCTSRHAKSYWDNHVTR